MKCDNKNCCKLNFLVVTAGSVFKREREGDRSRVCDWESGSATETETGK